ncbi:MAG TPA: hypothetical protein VLL48_09130 [Longimicrobiales bacterium]|nr:hypothetical protein [Longimicrobiales bacterium]
MPSLNERQMILVAEQLLQARLGPSLQTRTVTIGAHRAAHPRDMIEPICRAIRSGHDQWRQQARFEGVVINGPQASGGRLVGPPLGPLIRNALRTHGSGDALERFGWAVAAALGDAWGRFTTSARVPALPWYPSFAAVPAAQAPPTPNVPTPLSACTFDRSPLEPIRLLEAMKREFGARDPSSGPLFEAVARAFVTAVDLWLPAQMVANVIGQGPVPSHAPPYVPTGPVLMGTVVPSGSHLST